MTANPILSVFFDLLIIFFIVKTIESLEGKLKLSKSTKFWASFLYLVAVLPTQLTQLPFISLATFGGVGIPYFSLIVVGIGWAILNISLELSVIFFLTLSIFLFQRISFIIYPFLAIFASLGMSYLIDYKISINGKYISYPKIFSCIFILISVLTLMLWPMIFSLIYTGKLF